MALTVTINGEHRAFENLDTGSTINQLLAVLELKADRVALEVNGLIVLRASWNSATVKQNDVIELVHFVGGGSDFRSNT